MRQCSTSENRCSELGSVFDAPKGFGLLSYAGTWLRRQLVELVFILLLIGGLVFWWRSTLSRENAVRFARRACGQCGVQLLDETVALGKLRLQRSNKGHMGIARWYTFEFSTSGADRRPGVVSLLGDQLLDMHLQLDMEELAQNTSSTNDAHSQQENEK